MEFFNKDTFNPFFPTIFVPYNYLHASIALQPSSGNDLSNGVRYFPCKKPALLGTNKEKKKEVWYIWGITLL